MLLAASSPPAQAEDVDAIIKKGNDLRRQRRDADALTEFRRAAQIESSPRVTAQMALAEQALGLWLDANLHLSQALEHGRDSWIAGNQKTLQRALATIQAHLCRLEVWGEPSGAEVFLDGKPVGLLPKLSAWLAPGDISLEAKAEGFKSFEHTLRVPEGENIREHIDLRRLAPTGVAQLTTPSDQTAGGAGRSSTMPAPAAVEPKIPGPADRATSAAAASGDDRHRWVRITGIVLGATGVAVAGVGLAFGMAAKADGEANARTGATFDASTYDAGHRDQTLQFVSYAIGAALIAGGVTTWLLGNHGQEQAPGASTVSFAPATGGGLALAAVRF